MARVFAARTWPTKEIETGLTFRRVLYPQITRCGYWGPLEYNVIDSGMTNTPVGPPHAEVNPHKLNACTARRICQNGSTAAAKFCRTSEDAGSEHRAEHLHPQHALHPGGTASADSTAGWDVTQSQKANYLYGATRLPQSVTVNLAIAVAGRQ